MKHWRFTLYVGLFVLVLGGGALCSCKPQQSSISTLSSAEVTRAAEQGDKVAQFEIGSRYLTGRKMPKNEIEAARWFRKSAEQGYARAQYNLAYFYHEGIGISKDNVEAVKWCQKAAEQKVSAAQNLLGVCYREGDGV